MLRHFFLRRNKSSLLRVVPFIDYLAPPGYRSCSPKLEWSHSCLSNRNVNEAIARDVDVFNLKQFISSSDMEIFRIILLLDILQIGWIAAHKFHTYDIISVEEILGTDVYFEIIEPKELAYTYKIRPALDFGTPFNESLAMRKTLLVLTEPPFACDSVKNQDELCGNFAFVERGDCSFLSKSVNVEKAGAIGVIVSDYDKNNDDMYMEMIDDNSFRSVNIPAGFLLGKNGYMIKSTLAKLNKKEALIRIPVNLTHVPLEKFNMPPWVGW